MERELRYIDRDGMRILSVKGEFDLSNADSLESFVALALADDIPVVLDFSETTYIDSTVLTVLVRQKKAAGARLRIVVPKTTKLRRIFDITGLHTGLGVEDSLPRANGSLNGARVRPEIVPSTSIGTLENHENG